MCFVAHPVRPDGWLPPSGFLPAWRWSSWVLGASAQALWAPLDVWGMDLPPAGESRRALSPGSKKEAQTQTGPEEILKFIYKCMSSVAVGEHDF